MEFLSGMVNSISAYVWGEEDNDTTPSPEKELKPPQVEVKSRLVQEGQENVQKHILNQGNRVQIQPGNQGNVQKHPHQECQ